MTSNWLYDKMKYKEEENKEEDDENKEENQKNQSIKEIYME